MKTKQILFILIVLGFNTQIKILAQTKVFIPDLNFRKFLNTNYPSFMDSSSDSLIVDSAKVLTLRFDCSEQNISDLSGIEYFINIPELYCYYNLLSELPDISSLTKLTYLWCSGNKLISLPDLSSFKDLEYLNCPDNELTSLPDLSNNTKLKYLNCAENQITILPILTNDTVLKDLVCYNNQLTSLPDLSTFINLRTLYCSNNQLTEISDLNTSVSNFTFICSNNQLDALPAIPFIKSIIKFECGNNKLDFSDALALQKYESLMIDDPIHTMFVFLPQNSFGDIDSVSINESDDVNLYINNQDSATAYQWYKEGNIINGANDTVLKLFNVSISDSGSYTCKSFGTALDCPPMNRECTSEFVSNPIHLSIFKIASIIDKGISSNIKIYPNPNNGVFSLNFYNQYENISRFEIYNSIGQIVLQKDICNKVNSINEDINIKYLPKGLYYLSIFGIKSLLAQKTILIK